MSDGNEKDRANVGVHLKYVKDGESLSFSGVHTVYLCVQGVTDPNNVSYEATVDASGTYQFTNIPLGQAYVVSVDKIWFCTPVIEVNVPTINQDVTVVTPPALPPDIPVPANKAVLAGKITKPTGINHTIKACDSSGVVKFSGGSSTLSWYRLIVDAPATYYMKIDDTWCTTATKTISVPADPDGTRHDIALP